MSGQVESQCVLPEITHAQGESEFHLPFEAPPVRWPDPRDCADCTISTFWHILSMMVLSHPKEFIEKPPSL
jgi:hypothetical protein